METQLPLWRRLAALLVVILVVSAAGLALLTVVGCGQSIAGVTVVACDPTVSPSPAPSASALAVVPTPSPSPSPTPTVEPTPSPSPSPTPTPSPTATPTPAPTPTDGPELHTATDLEAVLPDSVSGIALHRTSPDVSAQLQSDSRTAALLTVLRFIGKSASDIRFAQATEEAEPSRLTVAAFQIRGIDARVFAQAAVGIVVSSAPGATTSTVTLGGKNVTKAVSPDGQVAYVYAQGDTVYGVKTTDEAVATAALQVLP